MKSDKVLSVAQLQDQLRQAQETIAQQEAQLQTLRLELEAALKPAVPTLNAELRAVSAQPELLDVREHPPTPGARLFALGIGGVLVPTVWTRGSASFFGAWMPYPKMPPSVKEWLATAWLEKQRQVDAENARKIT